jgi:formate dehydrogenase subunit beta
MGDRFLLKIDGENVNKGLKDFLLKIMEKDKIDNIILPTLIPSKDNIFPALIKRKELLENAKPVAPVLPVSTASMVSRITKMSPSPEKILVFLKPCELRALLELAKFKQISLENLLLVSFDCMGVYETDSYQEAVTSGKNVCDEYASNSLLKGVQEENVRDACKMCEYFYPMDFADISVGFIGVEGGMAVEGGTDKGKEILNSLDLEKTDAKERDSKIEKMIEERKILWGKRKEEVKKEISGIEGFSTYFAKCINCHNCMSQCPICFCKECFWESPTFEFTPLNFLGWAKKRGAVKLPTDTVFFHLGRLTHMSTSCVACGLCSDACPKDIDVYELFHLVADDTQAAFEYKPGRDIEEEAPLTTFKEDELKDLG